MRALVTGSAGLCGRYMVQELKLRGWDVECCDLVASDPAEQVDARTVFQLADVQYDLISHCAYHVGGRAGIDGEPRNLALNLELDAAMFDFAYRTRAKAVLYWSSSAAYPERLQREPHYSQTEQGIERHRLAEDDVDLDHVEQPDARYGWAKLTGEQLARAAAQLGLRVHVVRPFSGYAGDQALDYPFPAIIQRANRGELAVWGPPGQVRDWIHIEDVIRGALAVYQADERRPVNLCSGVAVEFGELMKLAAQLAGWNLRGPVEYQQDQPTGVLYRVGDPARMARIYQPAISLVEGIEDALSRSDAGPRSPDGG